MKKIIVLFVVVLMTTALFAGGQAEGSADAEKTKDKLFIGFSAGYSKCTHWDLEIKGVADAAAEFDIEFYSKYANGDQAQQVSDVENMVEMGIDMLIIGPNNSDGIVPTLEGVRAKGIAVATSDIGVTGGGYVSHVASDNYGIGVTAANYVGEKLGGKGSIAMLGWASASATADRTAGFLDTMTEKYPDIIIVANVDVQSDRTKSMTTSETLLQSNPEIEFFFGANADCALGAYAATKNSNRSDVFVISVDSDGDVMDAIQAGTNLIATVAQNPYMIGYNAGMNAIKHLMGEDVKDIAIESKLVTIENVQDILDRDAAYLVK